MFVKNNSARVHHIGDAIIVPGQVAEIPDEYAMAINHEELEVVDELETPEVAEKPKTVKNAKK